MMAGFCYARMLKNWCQNWWGRGIDKTQRWVYNQDIGQDKHTTQTEKRK